MPKSLYDVLGLTRDASTDDIRKAFRTLAKTAHPDRGGSDAAFKELNEAHQVLSDPEKRYVYDVSTPPPVEKPRWTQRPQPSERFEDLFNEVLSDFQFRRKTPSEAPRRRPEPGLDVNLEVSLSVEESISGCKKAVRVHGVGRTVLCGSCGGDGSESGTPRIPCLVCHGMAHRNPGRPCGLCRNTGFTSVSPCRGCKGFGYVPYVKDVTVTVPSGISEGQKLRVAGYGSPGHPPGDLYVTIRVRAGVNGGFWRDGLDVHTHKAVTMRHAILGGPICVEGPGGRMMEVDVPAGTQPGDLVKVRAMGARGPLGGSAGDLVVHVDVSLPRSLSPRGRKLLEELSEEMTRGPQG